MTLWMEVTMDEYELPVAVAESVHELARLRKINPNTIYTAAYAVRSRKRKRSRYVKVEIEEDSDEEQ